MYKKLLSCTPDEFLSVDSTRNERYLPWAVSRVSLLQKVPNPIEFIVFIFNPNPTSLLDRLPCPAQLNPRTLEEALKPRSTPAAESPQVLLAIILLRILQ